MVDNELKIGKKCDLISLSFESSCDLSRQNCLPTKNCQITKISKCRTEF